MDTNRAIATNILRLLDERNIPATDLAQHLGVTRQTLTNYLKGISIVDSVKLVQIASFFNVSLDELINEKSEQVPAILFRSVLNYEVATDDFSDSILEYINRYVELAKSINRNICFIPEQYNLSVQYQGSLINVNYECSDYSAPKLVLDEELEVEIERIADEQRRLIGMEDKGALSIISALTQRGINIFFKDFCTSDISGLSVCDDTRGCYIFINDNAEISVERKLFTIAHEYAHIILHRPLYKRRIKQYLSSSKKKNLLDSMADCFAGYFLCPRKLLLLYNSTLQNFNSLTELFPVKKDLQISLSSLMMGMKRYGYINYATLSSYFAYLKKNGIDKIELEPISNDETFQKKYELAKTAAIIKMLKTAFYRDILKIEDFKFFINLPDQRAEEYLKEWQSEKSNGEKVSARFGDLIVKQQ